MQAMKTQRKVSPISRDRAIDYLTNETKGLIFSAHFIKKDDTMRHMVCRRNVKKHLAGGKLPYNAALHGLLPVYDLEQKAYRTVNLMTLISFNVHGETFIIN